LVLIDAHTNIGISRFGKFRPHLSMDYESLIKKMDYNQIDVAVVTPNPRPEVRSIEIARTTNNYVAEAVRNYPERLIGFSIVSTTGEEGTLGELERSIKQLGLRGVTIYETMGEALNLQVVSPILERASKLNIPVLFHAGPPGSHSRGEKIGFFAERFPEVTFIMAHMGGPWGFGVQIAKFTKNIILETSGGSSKPEGIKMAVKEVGYDRVVWGSGTPHFSIELELLKLKWAGLTKKEYEAVSWKNISRILGLEI
jgi:predicted TIM-barrel fold metal-dependent hydrolase